MELSGLCGDESEGYGGCDDVAEILAAGKERVYRITKWLGVNQAQEGESRLSLGEAADMRNFRITSGGALRKRPGSRNVAGLLNAFNLVVNSSVNEVLMEERGTSEARFTMYPTASVSGTGEIVLSGAPETVTNANADGHVGWYYRDGGGLVHKFRGVGRS